MRGWKLTFRVAGRDATEGLLEDVTRAQGDEVHGVIYRFGDADLERIAELAREGGLYERVEAIACTYEGSDVPVVVYVGRLSRHEVAGRPSDHRLHRIWRAAEEMQLAPSYVQALCMDHAAATACGPQAQAEAKSPARLVLDQSERIYELVGHDNFGSLSESLGFLPRRPPRLDLPPAFAPWLEVATRLPELYRDLRVRAEIDELPVLPAGGAHLEDRHLLCACQVLAMLAHAYWHCEPRPPARLPAAVSAPWEEVRNRLGRGPAVLSYLDLVVYNWELIDPARPDPMRVENLRLLLPTVDNVEERLFYLTQTEILAQCSPVVGAAVRAQDAVLRDDPETVAAELLNISACLEIILRESMHRINPVPSRKPYMDPVVWAKTVAPFAVPTHEGLPGPSGTSTPVFHVLDVFFGRKRYKSVLGEEIQHLRDVYPPLWRRYLTALQEVSVTRYIERTDHPALRGLLRQTVELYAGDEGFLGRHRMKVYGYLEQAFKLGRSVTIGGFTGLFADRTWDEVDGELEAARTERVQAFPRRCQYARVKQVTSSAGAAAHIVLDVEGQGVWHEPGDRCLILPENRDALVERTLAALGAGGDERIELTAEWRDALRLRAGYEAATSLSLRDVLRFGRIRPVAPRTAEALWALSRSDVLGEEIREKRTARWELWDLLELLRREGFDPASLFAPDAQAICRALPPESFRPYSIASVASSETRGMARELHLLVGHLEYEDEALHTSQRLRREGTASSFLMRAAGREAPISMLIERPPRFELPRDPRTPIVMFAGGTGVAPFRSFLLARARQPDAGDNYLYLSVRARDQLYFEEDLRELVREGRLKLEVIFSRDDASLRYDEVSEEFIIAPGRRRHVDEVLREPEHASRFSSLLRAVEDGGRGASVYLCGRTGYAKQIKATLSEVLDDLHGRGVGAEVLTQMSAAGRCMEEVFTDARTWDASREQLDVSDIAVRNDGENGYWTVIDGLVYDVTRFIEEHPGGARVLAGYAGIDSTDAYRRAHGRRAEVDAIREMYEIGAVRQLALAPATVDVVGPSGLQQVSLAAAYRMWVAALYLVVEMQNALRHDQSLQHLITTRGDPPAPRSLLKLRWAVEAHERFVQSYAGGLASPLQGLWTVTSGFFAPTEDPNAMKAELAHIARGAAYGAGRVAIQRLAAAVEEASARKLAPSSAERVRLVDTLATLERRNARLLADVKEALRAGVRVFEAHEHTLPTRGGAGLMDSLHDAKRSLAAYHEQIAADLTRAGWIAPLVGDVSPAKGAQPVT